MSSRLADLEARVERVERAVAELAGNGPFALNAVPTRLRARGMGAVADVLEAVAESEKS